MHYRARLSLPFPESVGLAHRAGQVEDQLGQGAALASAINPLPRHVHEGLQVLLGAAESPYESRATSICPQGWFGTVNTATAQANSRGLKPAARHTITEIALMT
jgi:hypothetical protein